MMSGWLKEIQSIMSSENKALEFWHGKKEQLHNYIFQANILCKDMKDQWTQN